MPAFSLLVKKHVCKVKDVVRQSASQEHELNFYITVKKSVCNKTSHKLTALATFPHLFVFEMTGRPTEHPTEREKHMPDNECLHKNQQVGMFLFVSVLVLEHGL